MATTTSPMKPQHEIKSDKATDFTDKTKEMAGNVADKAREAWDTAGNVADKARDTAANVAGKARDTAANVADKAWDTAGTVVDKAKETAADLGKRAESATHAVGSGMKSLAGTLRESLPHEGVIGAASSTVASGLETSGRYLEKESLQGIAEDVTNLVRRNPIPALLLAVGLGFILARATSSRS